MKTLVPLCCAFSLILTHSMSHADFYKWKDSRGNIQYGDNPPANVNAKPMALPKITIIDNYAEQWKPVNFEETPLVDKPVAPKSQDSDTHTYNKLAFVAPKQNQAIRANDGDVTAMVSVNPPLKKGHQLVFSLDGKAMKRSNARTYNFSNLDRGSHNIGVKIIDSKGNTIKNSAVSFNVLRTRTLGENQINEIKRAPQARTLREAQQQLGLTN